MCPLKLSRGWIVNKWSSIFTPLNVSTELMPWVGWKWFVLYVHFHTRVHRVFFITWLCWEIVELYVHSLTWVYWTIYHVAPLRMGGALPSLLYMCPQNFLSRFCVENVWSSTSTPLHVSTELFTRGLVEKVWSSTSTLLHVSTELFVTWLVREWVDITSNPLHVYTELFITWLGWERFDLYLHSPTWVHWTFYHVAVLRMVGDPPPHPCIFPLKVLSRGYVKIGQSSSSIPLHVSIEGFFTWLG